MMEQEIALITGANKGIGKEIARQLGAKGLTVFIGARDLGRGAEAAAELKANGIEAHVLHLNVTNQASINTAAGWIGNNYGRLDILVNNAGIQVDKVPASTLDIETLRLTFETNLFGVFAVTKTMLPLLKKSEAGRIVNISSGLGSLAENSNPGRQSPSIKMLAYKSSKAALNMMSIIFASELKDTSIKVNSADPGYTATDLNQHRATRTVEEAATVAVRLATLLLDGPTGGFFDENGPVPW